MSDLSLLDDLPEFLRNHVKDYLESDGKVGHMWDSTVVGGPGLVPTLLLTTRGRHSGRPRIVPMIYGQIGSSYSVVASKAGADTDPAWYLNLVDQPEVQVQVADKKFKAVARTASADEKAAIWSQMVKIYPPYDHYQAQTKRNIPVVLLDPITP